MGFSSLALTAIKLIRPRRMLHALLGKLMKGLADEFRSGKPSMNPNRFAAALYDRGNTRVFLDVCSVMPAQSIRTKHRQKTRSQLFSCSWKIFEEKMIRVRFEKVLNLAIKFLNHLIELTQLAYQAFGRYNQWFDQGEIVCHMDERLLFVEAAFRSAFGCASCERKKKNGRYVFWLAGTHRGLATAIGSSTLCQTSCRLRRRD